MVKKLNIGGKKMGYNNNYNNNRNYNNNGYNNNQPKKKKTGCRIGTDKKNRPCITAWNVSKGRGFISMVSVPCKVAKTKSKNSDKWVASVRFPDGVKTFTAFYNVQTKKLTIPDLAMVANPAKNYFGTYVTRK